MLIQGRPLILPQREMVGYIPGSLYRKMTLELKIESDAHTRFRTLSTVLDRALRPSSSPSSSSVFFTSFPILSKASPLSNYVDIEDNSLGEIKKSDTT